MKLLKTIFQYALLLFGFFPITSSAQNWEGVGGGADSNPRTFFSDTSDNYLYVGGGFGSIGGISTIGIARWDGSAWDSVGSGMTSCCIPVLSITRYKGELYAGGLGDNGIAKWDGVKWNSVVTGVNGGVIGFLVHNDDLYVGGVFDSVGSIAANSLAKWNGTSWSDVYALPNYNGVNWNFIGAMAYYKGELYVAGNFGNSGGYQEIVRYDGTSWQPLGSGILGDSWVNALQVYNNELYVGGFFTKIDGSPGDYIAKWNGSEWSEVGGGVSGLNGQVKDFAVLNNELYAVGAFVEAGGIPAHRIAKWDGIEWCGLGSVFNNIISSIGVYDSDIYIGTGTIIDSDTVNRIAKWVGGNYVDTCGVIVDSQEESIYLDNQLIIYPNPTTGQITVTNLPLETTRITVYSVVGELVQDRELTGNERSIDLSGLPDGLYLIQLENGQGKFSVKAIKQ